MQAHIRAYLDARVRMGELKPTTARQQRTTLYQFAEVCNWRDVSTVTRRDIRRWLERAEPWAPGTRRQRFETIRTFLRHMHADGVLRSDPTRGMRAPKEPRRLPRAVRPEQVTKVLLACPDARARLCAILMVQQGLRRIEVCRLEIGDLDLSYRMMRVHGKGDAERALPITDETMAHLRAYLAEHPATSGPLIRSYQHPRRGLHPDTVSSIVTRAMYAAGVKERAYDGTNPHGLRHGAATDMLRAGAHVRDVQHALGHASLVTTETYLPLVVHSLEDAMEGRRYSVDS